MLLGFLVLWGKKNRHTQGWRAAACLPRAWEEV